MTIRYHVTLTKVHSEDSEGSGLDIALMQQCKDSCDFFA